MKKENILINGCSRGLATISKNLRSKFNVYGLSSIKNNKNIFYYNPFEKINLDNDLIVN